MIHARIVVLLLTAIALIYMGAHQNPPSRMVETPYCVVDTRAAAKDQQGHWHIFWTEMYAPCSQQDRFVNA